MFALIGLAVVVGCVLLGYAALGGHLGGLWQPYEMVIVVGSAFGGFLVMSTKETLAALPVAISDLIKGPKYGKDEYMQLLGLMYSIFRTMKMQGNLVVEAHVGNPQSSSIFSQFPSFLANERAVNFFCDYLRMVTMGSDDPHQIEELMDGELQTQRDEQAQIPAAMQQMSDAFPGLGICAAVLGVIHTMDYITEPPAVIGGMVGAALVGTLMGVLFCYGFFGPIASGITGVYGRDIKYFECIKVGLLAHLYGHPPAISVEYARKVIFDDNRPTFYEVEQTVANAPAA